MQDISDDIIMKASEGDIAAFEMIYKATSGFVYNVAIRIIDNREDAEEVTQEVFLIMHKKLKEFRRESSLKTWAYRIAVNCALNFSRRLRSPKNNRAQHEDFSGLAIQSEMDKVVEKEHFDKVIDRILNVLPAQQRACIVLRNIEGLSYQQIAEVLQININTVRSRLKRARERILATHKQVNDEAL